MTQPRASLVVIGEVVVEASPDGLRTAEGVGIADGRVVSVGTREDVLDAAAAGATVIDAGAAAVVPGLHDFHLHLAGMAHARLEVALDDVVTFQDLIARVRHAAERLPNDAWLRGRGWVEAAIDHGALTRLERAVDGRPALLYSHDGHSAWASAAALRLAGVDAHTTPDPGGGRIERDAAGGMTGVLRERATDMIEPVAGRTDPAQLSRALDETVAELLGWGITGATDAGDSSPENGIGAYAAIGDSGSSLLDARDRLDGRLRLTVNLPAAAIEAGAELGLRTGSPIAGTSSLRAGWAKAYADGALGSRTAALFEPYSCGDEQQVGILRLESEDLDRLLAAGRAAGIGLAVHAIGDRAAAAVLDAIERSPERGPGVPPHRIEHLQLMRPSDPPRLAALDVTASVQPIHAASDRELVERCWQPRQADAYPWRALAASGARLAFGSDAPIESPNPWHGLFAAVHRRFPGDGTVDWRTEQALDLASALGGYTLGPARSLGMPDEGHLRPGARADLAVLSNDLATLLSADERVAAARAVITLVGGHEVQRS
ncbi:MAG TPA: amidohydrolase [Candidatus Binatia bacterium]|nr:amidohydrolase [Candidatus Binatia bacterium]